MNMRHVTMAFVATLTIAGAAQGRQPPAASSVAQAPVSAEAQRFAELYMPADRVRAQARASFAAEAARTMEANPQSKQMEARYPGIGKAAIDAGAVVIDRAYAERLPAMQGRVAALVAGAFKPAEIAQLTTFLASDAGQALQRGVASNIDTAGLADRARRGETTVTADALQGSIDAAGALGTLTPEQIRALATFSATPLGRRFEAFSPRLLALVAEDTSALVQGAGPKVGEAMMLAIRQRAGAGK